MAAIPASVTENATRNSSDRKPQGPLSYGRGGAGNIGNSKNELDPVTLETPTIKSDIYTTGRGGSGNMAKNSDPEEARRAQDVTAHPRSESNHSQHVGRGGGGNVFKPSKEELDATKKDSAKLESATGDDQKQANVSKPEHSRVKGLADKGKELLFGKK